MQFAFHAPTRPTQPTSKKPRPASRASRRAIAIGVTVAMLLGGLGSVAAANGATSSPRSATAPSQATAFRGWRCFAFQNTNLGVRVAFLVSITRDRGQKHQHLVIDTWAEGFDSDKKIYRDSMRADPVSVNGSVDSVPTFREDSGNYGLGAITTYPKKNRSRTVLLPTEQWPGRTMMRDRQAGFYIPIAVKGVTAKQKTKRVRRTMYAIDDFSLRVLLSHNGANVTGASLEAVYPHTVIARKTWGTPERTTSGWRLSSTGNEGFMPGSPWCA